MLQWMGGSRRKVNASRKSTRSRQKQYFDQRKRQQNTPGLENQIDIANKRVNSVNGHRSLDVVSLIDLAAIAQHNHCDHTDDNGSSKVSLHVSKPSLEIRRNSQKTSTSGHSNNLSEAGSEPENLFSTGSQDAADDYSEKWVAHEMPTTSKFASKKVDTKRKEQTEEVQGEDLLLDLLGDETKSNNVRALPEAHVAFSVKGLGKVGVQTPAHSPKSRTRSVPSPPRAFRHTRTEVSRFNVAEELDSIMHDIHMTEDDRWPERMIKLKGILDEPVGAGDMQFVDLYSPDSFTIRSNFDDQIENLFAGRSYQETWQFRNDYLDDNSLGKKYDGFRKINPFPSPNVEKFDVRDYDFRDHYFPTRAATKDNKRLDTSEPYSTCFSRSTMEKEGDPIGFDWDRHHTSRKRLNFDSIFNRPVRSSMEVADLEDNTSFLSEESCSSTGVIAESNYNRQSQTVKVEENKIRHMDEFQFDLDYKLDCPADEPSITGLGGNSYARGLTETPSYKGMRNHSKSEAGFYKRKTSSLQGIPEPDFLSSIKEDLANQRSTITSSHKSRFASDKISPDCHLTSEHKLSNMFPDLKLDIDLFNTRSRLKTLDTDSNDPFNRFNCNSNIPRKRTVAGIHSQELLGPYTSCAEDVEKDTEMCSQYVQKHDEKNNSANSQRFQRERKAKISADSDSIGTEASADSKDICKKNEDRKYATENPSGGSGDSNHPKFGEQLSIERLEVTAPLKSYCKHKDALEVNSELEKNIIEGIEQNECDGQYQVMLESYVLQLFCVQKVLIEASKKDNWKKAAHSIIAGRVLSEGEQVAAGVTVNTGNFGGSNW